MDQHPSLCFSCRRDKHNRPDQASTSIPQQDEGAIRPTSSPSHTRSPLQPVKLRQSHPCASSIPLWHHDTLEAKDQVTRGAVQIDTMKMRICAKWDHFHAAATYTVHSQSGCTKYHGLPHFPLESRAGHCTCNTCKATMITYEAAMATLQSMFGEADREVLSMVLESNGTPRQCGCVLVTSHFCHTTACQCSHAASILVLFPSGYAQFQPSPPPSLISLTTHAHVALQVVTWSAQWSSSCP